MIFAGPQYTSNSGYCDWVFKKWKMWVLHWVKMFRWFIFPGFNIWFSLCVFVSTRVQVSTRPGGRSTVTCLRRTFWAVRWSEWPERRTSGKSWWGSTLWWRWTGPRARPRCSDPTLWPTASETSTANGGRSVHETDLTTHNRESWQYGEIF